MDAEACVGIVEGVIIHVCPLRRRDESGGGRMESCERGGRGLLVHRTLKVQSSIKIKV